MPATRNTLKRELQQRRARMGIVRHDSVRMIRISIWPALSLSPAADSLTFRYSVPGADGQGGFHAHNFGPRQRRQTGQRLSVVLDGASSSPSGRLWS